MNFAAAERQRLATTLLALGPDAPTLCEGWTAHHLAAHLVIRENDPVAAAGMFVPLFRNRLERAMAKQLNRDFEDVVGQWGRGPQGIWKVMDSRANVLEHFVHHEDVRRPHGLQPRSFSTADAAELYRAFASASWLFRRSTAAVELWPAGHVPILCGDRSSSHRVQVFGELGELVLFANGRPALGVDWVGDGSLVQQLRL